MRDREICDLRFAICDFSIYDFSIYDLRFAIFQFIVLARVFVSIFIAETQRRRARKGLIDSAFFASLRLCDKHCPYSSPPQ